MLKHILLLSVISALSQCQPLSDTEVKGRDVGYDRFYFYRPPNTGSNPGSQGENPNPGFEEKFKSKKGSIGEKIDRIGEAARLTIKEEKDAAKKAFQSVGAAAGQTAAAGFNVLKSKLGMLFVLPKLAINAIALKPTEKTTEAPGNTTTPKSTEAPANSTTEAPATTTTAKSGETPEKDEGNKDLEQAVTDAINNLKKAEKDGKSLIDAVKTAEGDLATAENNLITAQDAYQQAIDANKTGDDLKGPADKVLSEAAEVAKKKKAKTEAEKAAEKPNKAVADAKTALEKAIDATNKAQPDAPK